MSNQNLNNLKEKNYPLIRIRSMFIMIVICLLVSLGPLLLRSMEDADIWQILFYRSLFWISALIPILAFRFRYNFFQKIFAIGKWGIIAGLFLSCAQIFYIQALSNATVANVTFVLSSIPFLTALIAYIFLREKIKSFTFFMMLIAGIGIYIMVSQGVKSGNSFGNIMAIMTAMCFACFPVILRKFRSIDMLPTMLVPAIVIGVLSILIKGNDVIISNNDLILCFIWGGIINGFAHTFFIAVTRNLLAAEITLFMLLEFILAPVWVWMFIGEMPASNTFTGGFFVISAIIMITLLEIFKNGKLDTKISKKSETLGKTKIEIESSENKLKKNNITFEEQKLRYKIDSEIEKYALRDIKLWIEKNFFRNLNDSLKNYFNEIKK